MRFTSSRGRYFLTVLLLLLLIPSRSEGACLVTPLAVPKVSLRLGAVRNFDRCAILTSLHRPQDALRRRCQSDKGCKALSGLLSVSTIHTAVLKHKLTPNAARLRASSSQRQHKLRLSFSLQKSSTLRCASFSPKSLSDFSGTPILPRQKVSHRQTESRR